MLPIISPNHFRNRMERYWTETLGLASNDGLREIWLRMAGVFGGAIYFSDQPEKNIWRVLQPPTGTGKTQGLCVYCALVANQNRRVDSTQRVGVLVVTRLISQCDELAALVNGIADDEVAVAVHSENRPSVWQIQAADILVITHQAYINAVRELKGGNPSKWHNLTTWDNGHRRLTVIDEALVNLVDEQRVSAAALSQAIGYIPQSVRGDFPSPIMALEYTTGLFHEISARVSNDPSLSQTKVVYRGTYDMPESLVMDGLREAMWSFPYDQEILGRVSRADRHRLRNQVDDTLRSVQAIMQHWAYYARRGDDHTFNHAEFVVPDEIPGPVVLDATATQNFIWELFGDRAEISDVPAGARSYQNVTLHVARSRGVGKVAMIEHHKERLPRLLADLEDRLDETHNVFLCCHKAVEPFAMTFNPAFGSYSVGHWGAIDGRNDWKDYNVAVLFGLSYRDQTWANNTFMAIRGLQPDEWIQNPVFEDCDDVRREMQQRQLAVSVVQAINRVQSRKAIDDDGNCLPTDVFVILPEDQTGNSVLAAIETEMPGIVVANWDFQLDASTERQPSIRKGSSHAAIVSYMQNQPPGEYPISTVKSDLEISDSVWRNGVSGALRDHDHPLSIALNTDNVSYLVRGRGRGARSYLVKL